MLQTLLNIVRYSVFVWTRFEQTKAMLNYFNRTQNNMTDASYIYTSILILKHLMYICMYCIEVFNKTP